MKTFINENIRATLNIRSYKFSVLLKKCNACKNRLRCITDSSLPDRCKSKTISSFYSVLAGEAGVELVEFSPVSKKEF